MSRDRLPICRGKRLHRGGGGSFSTQPQVSGGQAASLQRGHQSVTVKPEDVVLEDANGGRALQAVPGSELARRMRHPYNWARFAITPVAGGEPPPQDEVAMVTPRTGRDDAGDGRAHPGRGGGSTMPGGKNLLYTDTPGALRSGEPRPGRMFAIRSACCTMWRRTAPTF